MTAGSGKMVSRTRPAPEEPWTVMRLIRWSADWLGERGVDDPRLDVELLLADALGLARLDLYLQHDRPLVPSELAAFKERLLRRGRREPLQYITGRAQFRELELRVDRRALIPRPETEVLVEEVLRWARVRARESGASVRSGAEAGHGGAPAGEAPFAALEIGTGTGAVALSLAVEGPFGRIVATDVSGEALALARENRAAVAPEAPVDFRRGSLYTSLAPGERFDAIVSNPPYVAVRERPSLAPEVRDWEPEEAVFAGPGGFEVLRPLIDGAPRHLRPGGLLALEVGEGQAGAAMESLVATGRFADPRAVEDLAGRPRVVLARRRA